MKVTLVFVQIALLITATIAFSYLVDQTNTSVSSVAAEGILVSKARALFIEAFGSNLVSAQEALWTCLKDQQGSVCQEYTSSTCAAACGGPCFPGRRADYSACTLGTCIDRAEGTCAPQTPRTLCEQTGVWKSQEASELVECRRGCCLIGDEAQFLTEQTCNVMQTRLGLPAEFRPVANEIACLALSNSQAEGACIVGSAEIGDISCTFGKKGACLERGGEFHENYLCSNPELNSGCQKQARIGCADGKDEVYWFDSCGNRENIYEANKAASWNLGKILGKDQSCQLGIGNNPLARQASCGNCNYLLGSVCGAPGAQDAKPAEGNAVCRNLNCIDSDGKTRKQGESWCAFESQIGVLGTLNGQRSVDVPGSTHYRQVCFEGEIKTEPCQGFRNEVCVQNDNVQADFSQAACRINQWQKCIDANIDKEKLAQCEQTTDCAIKKVVLGTFAFDRCVPRYPPGFDLNANFGGEVGESLCALGSQKCTVTYQKGFGGWKCKQNCQCVGAAFTETMNNLCMSIGDCGASANILGEVTESGYSVKNAPKLNQNYLSALKNLATPREGQKVTPLSAREIEQLLNIDPNEPTAIKQDRIGEFIGYIGLGGTGVLVAYAAASGATIFGAGALTVPLAVPLAGPPAPLLGAFGSALGAAAAGAAIGFVVAKLLGLQGDAVLATVVGGLVGSVIITQLFSVQLFTFAFFIWTAIIAVVFALVFKLLGIGKTKRVVVDFQCKPWQPPKGGAQCEQCGKDGLPCNKYQCQSLGQLCELVNEGTSEVACINSNPNDVAAPLIQPFEGALLPGFSYTSVSSNGYTLRGGDSDGCVPAYTQIRFGVSLNERAACKIDTVRTGSFDAMEFDFGGSSLYRQNHTQAFFVPALDAAAQAQVNGSVDGSEAPPNSDPIIHLDPNKKNDLTLFVRCQDKSGNANANEYAINFCISAAPDRTAPIITSFVPPSPSFAAFGVNSKNVTFFVNEPSQCRWSLTDSDYDSMGQQAACATDVEDATLLGYTCSALLPVTADSNNYYFRCKDQPWLTGNVTLDMGKTRNKNAQSSIYTVQRSSTPLRIDSVTPNGTVSSGGLPVVVDIEVHTSGGADGTARYCEFSSAGQFIRFFSSSGNVHKQPGLQFIEQRAYSIPIRCRDDAGNEALSSAQFSTFIDSVGPAITRVYQSSGLVVITNEPAICAYSLSSCAFLFSNGTRLDGQELVHSTEFNRTATHYVTCRDRFDNPGTCVAVRGGAF